MTGISKEQFKTIFDESLDVVIIIDPESGNILCVNNTVRYSLGYEVDTLIGRHFSALFPDDNSLKPQNLLEETRVYGPVFAEQCFLSADGSICPMDLTTTLIPWGKGHVILVTLRDIIEHRRVEEALKRTEGLIENALDLIAILNADGIFRYASPSHKRLLGYEPEELIGRSAFDLIHPDDGSQVRNRLTHLLQNSGGAQPTEFRFRHKDGSWLILESTGKTLTGDSGEAGVVINSRDITERKKAEETLHESEERYRTLFDQSPVGVYIFDKDYKITHCNERFAQVLQSSYDKITGIDLRRLKNQCVLPLIERVLAGQTATYEGFYEATNSPAKLWVSIHLSPLRDSKGNVTGGMAVVEDITERKRMEEELLKAEKLESLGVLAGGIAHDFNNLLTSILGNISLTKMYLNSEDKAYKRLSEAERACLRTKDLTQQLLTFSKGGHR